ncbi:MAG: choice-of-anchor L domain-containing protein [Phycisphaerales bacterium]|nr:MAG: choice-of-anchor L domain-containing protein [Phycisphaerales bacterium]
MRQAFDVTRRWALVSLTVVQGGGIAAVSAEAAESPRVIPRAADQITPQYAPGDGVIDTRDLNDAEITPEYMVRALFGDATRLPAGVVSGSAKFNNRTTGPYSVPIAGGVFTNGGTVEGPDPDGPIGIPDGVILSTGDIFKAQGDLRPDTNTVDAIETVNRTRGDNDLSALLKANTLDAAALEFDINVTSNSTLVFKYVFTSDEYNEWVFWGMNDGFGIFVTDLSQPRSPAWVPNGNPRQYAWVLRRLPICVNSVNNGNPYGSANAVHPELYYNNDCTDIPSEGAFPCAPPNHETEMDGLSHVLTSRAVFLKPNGGAGYRVKLVIADSNDRRIDTNVFIRGRFTSCCRPVAGGRANICEDGVSQSDCTSAGGAFHDGALCCDLSTPCDGSATGSCCSPGADCKLAAQMDCENAGGTWGGDLSCGVQGACCLDGVCVEMTEDCCDDEGGNFHSFGNCDSLGACNNIPGSPCVITTSQCCTDAGGTHAGNDTECVETGACCYEDASCAVTSRQACAAGDGTFVCRNSQCVGDICDLTRLPVPAVSEWGLAVMALLGLAAATIVFRRARMRAAR